MNFLFIDDTTQSKPIRDKIGKLVGVGGLVVHCDKVQALEQRLEEIVRDTGFPDGEIFKWSPAKTDWMRSELVRKERTDFFQRVLAACSDLDAVAFCSINDTGCRVANSDSVDHDDDVLTLLLERFDTHNKLSREDGFVIAAKPRGGSKDENKFLESCIRRKSSGSDFVCFTSLALNVVTMPYSHSRILQASDLVVSATNALVAGFDEYASEHLESLRKLLHKGMKGQIGGSGLKLHPDSKFRNLYHWIWGDVIAKKGSGFVSLPDNSTAFSGSKDVY